MNALLMAHVGGGLLAILAGAIAIAARKGGSLHALARTWLIRIAAAAVCLIAGYFEPDVRGVANAGPCSVVNSVSSNTPVLSA